MEEHLTKIALRETVSRLRGNKASLNRAVLHALVINTAAVIFDFDVNLIAAVIRAQHDVPRWGLPSADSFAAVFDTVRDRIAHQVNKRIGNLLDDVVVKFGFTAREIKRHLLAG